MPDDLDASLRRELWASGVGWAPTHAVENTRVELELRVRRRRRVQALVGATALASVTFLVALAHGWPPGAASGHLTADPPALRPGPGHGAIPGPGSPRTAPPTDGAGGSARSPAGATGAGHTGGGDQATARSAPPPALPAGTTTTTTTTTTTPATVTGPPTTLTPGSTTVTVSPTTIVPPSTTTTTTTATPGTSTTVPAGVYIFTNADSGTSARVPDGAAIQLQLTACAGTTWSAVHTSAPGVVMPVSTAPNPAAGSLSAKLAAVQQGTATLQVRAHLTCPLPSAVFLITIDVT